MIRFNEPHIGDLEKKYILEALTEKRISGGGAFSEKCQIWFKDHMGLDNNLLTSSCTHSLEMAALLADIQPGDRVLLPSYTFVTSALPFYLRGAELIFIDSKADHPNLDESLLEQQIAKGCKCLIPMHYGGISCDMDKILELQKQYGFTVIEDAAHSVKSFFKGNQLGGIGDFGTFSFHETKNITSGEGGLLICKSKKDHDRAEIIADKGTNRSAFFKGQVDKYNWVDIGSSYRISDLLAALLYGQLKNLEEIQSLRVSIWTKYMEGLKELGEKEKISLCPQPDYSTNNGHLFYLTLNSAKERNSFISYLEEKGIKAVFHYQSLHKSPFFAPLYSGPQLPNADKFTEQLVRLPLFAHLDNSNQDFIIECIWDFFK